MARLRNESGQMDSRRVSQLAHDYGLFFDFAEKKKQQQQKIQFSTV